MAFGYGSNLTGADFRNARLTDSVIAGAINAARANFAGVVFTFPLRISNVASFAGANFAGVDFAPVKGGNGTYIGSWLRGPNFTGTNFAHARLVNADFDFNKQLHRVNMSSADLSGVQFSEADLTSANLSRATMLHVNLVSANLTNADLTNTDLATVVMLGANLTGANLKGSTLPQSNAMIGVKWGHTSCPDGHLTDTGC